LVRDGLIIEKHKNNYRVDSTDGCFEASLKGVLKKSRQKPVVGDRITFELLDSIPPKALVQEVKKRTSYIRRPAIANIEQILFVTTVREPAVDREIIDRFLFNAAYHELVVMLVFNKTDVLHGQEESVLDDVEKVYRDASYQTLRVSAKTGENTDAIIAACQGKISTFAGISGVGKSTLLNTMLPGIDLKTSELSAVIDRGVHTTTVTRLIKLDRGGYIADTPGFAWIDLPYVPYEETGLYFPEIAACVGECKFNNCLHLDEPGCVVKEKIDTGEICESRYDNYVKFLEVMKEHRDKYKKQL